MGYSPQVAAERLRIAEALDALPEIDEALASGDLPYSAVRELTRIATPKTAGAWVKACRGKVVRQIEEMVAEREVGDAPESKPKPQVRPRRFSADLRPDVDALVRQARQVLEAERGEKLDLNELMEAFAARVLEPATAGGKAQRPRHQVIVTVCKACNQGWQRGAGRENAISAVDAEVAMCDAQHVDDAGRLTQSIPAARRRAVWRRDHGRCRIPGCRASRFIDVHHLLPREHGGTHELTNLALLCAGHHRALHAGLIVIEGDAASFNVLWISNVPHVGDSADSDNSARGTKASIREVQVPHVGDLVLRDDHARDVEAALVRLGFRRVEAREAVARAIAQSGASNVEVLMREALRACPRPVT
jgi:5-methylcytosine-specific restriction endonuclease McrA